MMIMTEAKVNIGRLAEDVLGCFHSRQEIQDKKAKGGIRVETGPRIYGKKDEEVTVIADHGNMVIVSNSKGERYSIRKDKIIYSK